MLTLEGKRVLVTGGTGSLGQTLVRRLLSGEMGKPRHVIVFSRDETKQYAMRAEWAREPAATDAIAYGRSADVLQFRIGDVRDYPTVRSIVSRADVVFNAAAMKQVPQCEYAPFEAVRTNIEGAENIVRACTEVPEPPELVIGVSTDKAAKPINVMGMCKAIQERIFAHANLRAPKTRFTCVRYGNVIASRGSVVPLFLDQIAKGGPVTITTEDMTRFLLSLDQAVDTIFAAVRRGRPGETWVPKVPSARIVDVARVLIGERKIPIKVTGIRPGEKIHEILIAEEESFRTVEREGWYAIQSQLPELSQGPVTPALVGDYSSAKFCLDPPALAKMLRAAGFLS